MCVWKYRVHAHWFIYIYIYIYDYFFFQPMYPFAFNKTHISITTEGLGSQSSAAFGNFINPAYATSFIQSFPLPYSFLHRVLNVIICITELTLQYHASSLQPVLHISYDFKNWTYFQKDGQQLLSSVGSYPVDQICNDYTVTKHIITWFKAP